MNLKTKVWLLFFLFASFLCPLPSFSQSVNEKPDSLFNQGSKLYRKGDIGGALQCWRQALDIWEKTPGTEKDQADCHKNIGAALIAANQYEEGIKYQNLALKMYEKIPGTERNQAGCHVNIGAAFDKTDQYEEAIKHQNLALEMYEKIPGTERKRAECCKKIGAGLRSLGKYEEDIKYQNLALEIYKKKPGTKKDRNICRLNIGNDLRYTHKFDEAVSAYCHIPKEERDWRFSLGLAKTYEEKGNPWEASLNYINAVKSAEEKREETLWKEAGTDVSEAPSNVYSCFARFLVSLSGKNMSLSRSELSALASSKDPGKANLEAAFYYSEAGKARTTLDLLHERSVNISGIKKSLIGKYQRPDIKKTAEEQEKIPEDTAVLEYVVLPEETVLFILTKNTIDAFRINIESQVPGDIAAMDEGAANKILTARFESGANGPSSAGVEAGKEKSSVGLEGLVKLYRQPMENAKISPSPRVYMETGKYLADLLIPEGARKLLKNVKHLLIVPDGVLYYLSFDALILGSNSGSLKPGDFSDCHYLVEDYAISYVPSLTLLDTVYLQAKEREKKRPLKKKKFAAFADPVFDGTDPRLKGEVTAVKTSDLMGGDNFVLRSYYKDRGLSLLRLPETKDESETIAGLFPEFIIRESPESLPSDKPSIVYTGLAATDIKVKSPEMKEYRYILFSTYGLVDAMNPWLSCIALTDEKPAGERTPAFLKVEDFFSMDLDADLITLSACQACLGRVKGGEGMTVFSTALFYAGASSICLSLWSTPSLASKAIMTEFYKGIAEGKLGKAEALRHAQLKLLQSDKKYAHPFFWAAFMLIGDYK